MTELLSSLAFPCGLEMKNRFMLAPLTNCQSHADGTLSDEEMHWLVLRAKGGFGLTMTCAAHVQAAGQGFPGQLGIWDDRHLEGLTRLAAGIKQHDSIAICQLHHAGMRSPAELIGGTPLCPSDNPRTGARAFTLEEVESLVEDFIVAAVRAQKSGFDGVELHGAHGYVLCQFFSPKINLREDSYGGSMENRFRILFEILDGIRTRCGEKFMLGVRLSGERFGLRMGEMLEIAERLMVSGQVDFLDMSLWECFKTPEEEAFNDKTLIEHFSSLPRGNTRLGVAGNIRTPEQAERIMAAGVDWLMLGRAAILNHNFPALYAENHSFTPEPKPTTRAHLREEGLSEVFIEYFAGNWPDYVSDVSSSKAAASKARL